MTVETGTVAVFASALLLAPASSQPAPGPVGHAGSCNVRDYGASGARAQNATAAVQKAVDACHSRGGGTAYVPLGRAAGAVFYLSRDEADFPRERAHVFAEGARNVAIRGRGRFDGQARY